MKKQKIILIVLMLGVISGISIFIFNKNYTTQASNQDIKRTSYKSSPIVNENGFQIDKYENIESEAWINDNEVLTLIEKEKHGEDGEGDIPSYIKYCRVYNLNTKESKEFKNADIFRLMDISPDKKYVLYVEARNIPTWDSEEYQKVIDSGDFFHRNVKLLDLSTGDITDVVTDTNNIDAEFKWVDNNKILINYTNKWAITDLTGKVIEEYSYKNNSRMRSLISGVDGIKDSDAGLEGKIYYTTLTSSEDGGEGATLFSMDVKTKEVKKILFNKSSMGAKKKGKVIIVDNFKNNGKQDSYGVYENRTFGALILDESGKTLHEINLPADRYASNYILCPDGSKAAYIEDTNYLGEANEIEEALSIKVIDTKTGSVKEIVKGTALNDKDPDKDYKTINIIDKDGKATQVRVSTRYFNPELKWDSRGTALSFIYAGNTYIVSFDN